MATNHGPPRKSAFLRDLKSFTGVRNNETYSIKLTMARFFMNRHGRTGSITEARRVMIRSQKSKAIHRNPETTSNVMTYADLQANCEPASSNAAVSDNVARRSSAAPTKSNRRRVSVVSRVLNVRRWTLGCPCRGKFGGMAIIKTISAGVAIGMLMRLVTKRSL